MNSSNVRGSSVPMLLASLELRVRLGVLRVLLIMNYKGA